MGNRRTDGELVERPGRLLQDELVEVLADRRRRCLLRCLADRKLPQELADLAEAVAARENDAPVTEVPHEDVTRVHSSLYHVHIPKLADANVVQYEGDRGVVTLPRDGAQLGRITEFLAIE